MQVLRSRTNALIRLSFKKHIELRLFISTRDALDIKSILEDLYNFLLTGLLLVLRKAMPHLSDYVGLADDTVTKRRRCMSGKGVEGLSEIRCRGAALSS